MNVDATPSMGCDVAFPHLVNVLKSPVTEWLAYRLVLLHTPASPITESFGSRRHEMAFASVINNRIDQLLTPFGISDYVRICHLTILAGDFERFYLCNFGKKARGVLSLLTPPCVILASG